MPEITFIEALSLSSLAVLAWGLGLLIVGNRSTRQRTQ